MFIIPIKFVESSLCSCQDEIAGQVDKRHTPLYGWTQRYHSVIFKIQLA